MDSFRSKLLRWMVPLFLLSLHATGVRLFAWGESADLQSWSMKWPRDEIRPAFEMRFDGGPRGQGSLVIRADDREGLHGWWEKTFDVKGGEYYEFFALRKVTHGDSNR